MVMLVTEAQLAELAALAPEPEPRATTTNGAGPRHAAWPFVDLVAVFRERGLYLKPLPGGKHAVECPFGGAAHASATSSTIIFEPRHEGAPWAFHCFASDCHGRRIGDVFRHLGLRTAPTSAAFNGAGEREGAAGLSGVELALPDWSAHLYDAADEWTFAPVDFIVEGLIPRRGVVWWGGLPKRFKSLKLVYTCLAIAAGRSHVAGRFAIRQRPRMLYVAREDSKSRVGDRKADILTAWDTTPEPGLLTFLIRAHVDLLDPAHVAGLRDLCRERGITVLVLDTWTALSPSADPMSAKDQAALAAVVVQLAQDIDGVVVVVDHSRKNRPDGVPLSSADIFGPLQKWAAAEHIVMLEVTSDPHRIEVFVEGKDTDTARHFLAVSPRASGEEKFTYAGTVEEIAEAQRAVGDQNRDLVSRAVEDAGCPVTPAEVRASLGARGIALGKETVTRHLGSGVDCGRLERLGQGRATKYAAKTRPQPSDAIQPRFEGMHDGART